MCYALGGGFAAGKRKEESALCTEKPNEIDCCEYQVTVTFDCSESGLYSICLFAAAMRETESGEAGWANGQKQLSDGWESFLISAAHGN